MAGLKPLPSEFGILPIGEMLVASDWLLKEFNLPDRVFFNSRNSTDYIVYGHLSSWKNEYFMHIFLMKVSKTSFVFEKSAISPT